MAKRVSEIMNHEVFCVVPDERASDVRGYFHALRIVAAPVVDDDGTPVGFVSLRDLTYAADSTPVAQCMTAGADTVIRDATIADAAAHMADRDRHHLAVVDGNGRIAGYVGSLDVVRGLIGKPVPHPATFAHYDRELDTTWTDDLPLVDANAVHAPDGPGLLRLIDSRAGQPDRVVWSEVTRNVRTRVLDLCACPSMPHLVEDLERGRIRFRAAALTKLGNIAAALHPKPMSTSCA
jgi:CBS domain-containing protein